MIAWVVTENFTSSSVLLMWATHLLAILFLVLTVYLLSFFILRNIRFQSLTEKFFFRTVSGLAAFCFISLPFFLLNIYSLITVLSILIAIWLVGFLFFRNDFSEEILGFFSALKQCIVLILCFVPTSYLALLPPYRYDEMSYHLAYVLSFARNSGVVTDPSMLHPLYTFNWHVVQTGMYLLGDYKLCHFLTWSTAVLASLGIYSFLKRFYLNEVFSIIASFSFYFTPMILEYNAVFLNDVPLMLFLFASVYSLYIFAIEKSKQTMILSMFCCSMFVGMKIINIVYIPAIIAIVLFWIKPTKELRMQFVFLFILIGSVWYIRNVIIDRDPVPPVLNFALGQVDKFWSKEDYIGVSGTLNIVNDDGFKRYLLLPWLMITSSNNTLWIGVPIFGYALLLPFVGFYAFIFLRKSAFIFWGLTSYAILVWMGTSYFSRYAHFLPLLVVAAMFVLNDLYKLVEKNKPIKWMVFLLICFVMFGPYPGLIRASLASINKQVPVSDNAIASFATYGNPEVIFSIQQLSDQGLKKGDNIYSFGFTHYKYYFMKYHYHIVGDYINKWRYADFADNLKKGTLDAFLAESGTKALFVNKELLSNYKDAEVAWKKFIGKAAFKKLFNKKDFWIVIL